MSPTPLQLLTEIERQQATLAELPADFAFPLFSGRQAVESQRRSGYRSTARAAREIIDNAVEAGARNIRVVYERVSEGQRKKHQPANSVSAIAFIDDGPGMLPEMIRYALSWGGGTHAKDPTGIGRFGFGLPNSSINQTRRVEVYSRTSGKERWMMGVLDINDVPAHGLKTIEPPIVANLPDFVRLELEGRGIKLDHGTVVVWQRPDRLSYKKATQLKEHMVEDFAVVYRDLLDKFQLFVEDVRVEPVDPLFLTPGARLYLAPPNGAEAVVLDRPVLVLKIWQGESVNAPNVELLTTEAEMDQAANEEGVKIGTVKLRAARFPYGFALGGKQYKGTDAFRRFEIRKPRRGISFVRAGREIETVDAFPKQASDESDGLGDWPLLQSYAYHWGLEISFDPECDEVFGIGNDKQTIRTCEDFWRVLAAAKVDEALRRENAHQNKLRRKNDEQKAKQRAEDPDRPNPATDAAAQASRIVHKNLRLPDAALKKARERFEETAERESRKEGSSLDKAREALKAEGERKPYAIRFFEAEGGVFYRPDFGNGLQRVAEINTAHPFYKVLYSKVVNIGDPLALGALDVVLLCLADAELRAEEGEGTSPGMWSYKHERESVWSPFLSTALSILDRIERSEEEDEGQGSVTSSPADG